MMGKSFFHDTLGQKLTVFYSVRYNSGYLAASDLFHMFTQSIEFYAFHYGIKSSEFLS